MVSICFENYHLTTSSLDRVLLKECPNLSIERQDHTIRKAIDKWPKTLSELELSNIKIDIIYDLEGLQIEGSVASSLKKMRLINLPSLSHIFLGPLSNLNFEKLYHLKIERCNKLRFILSASILQSLPVLMKLEVLNCEELVQIIEETHLNPHPLSEKCFPELKYIDVRGCKSLKCLFHISTFGCNQGDTKVLKDVFPNISTIQLIDLPSLDSIFHGIDNFEMVPCGVEIPCHEIYLISTATLVWQRKQRRQQTQEIEMASDQTIHSEQSNTSPERSFVPSESEFSSNIEVNVGKGPSSEKENKPTSSTHSNIEIAYSGPSTSTKELHENKSMSEEEAYVEITDINESPRRIDNPFNNAQIVTSLDDTSTLDIDTSVGEGTTSSEKEIKAISSPQLEPETLHPSPLISTKEWLVRKEVENEKIVMEQAITEKNESSEGEGPLLEKYHKATSSTHLEPEFCEKESMGDTEAFADNTQEVKEPNKEHFSKARSNKTALAIPPKFVEMKDSASSEVVSLTEDTSPLGRLMVNEIKTYTEKNEVGQINTQFADDDLIRLFQIVEEGADIRGHMPYFSEISALKDGNKVAKAFSEVQVLLKMNVSEVASSEENSLRLENALNFLSSHYSEDGEAPWHKLKAKVDTIHQEISSILSSFKQASARLASIDTFTKLEEKEKCIDKELHMQKEAALTLVSEIHEIKKSMQELTEDISRLQAELNSKEKQIQECKIKLSEKEKSVWETIGFLEDYEATKEDRSQIEEDTMMAKQELEKVNYKWSSCEAKWWKTLLLQRIYRKQKL